MKKLIALGLLAATVAFAGTGFAAELGKENEDPDWSPAKSRIFEMKTGREPGNLTALLGGGGEPAKRPEHKVVQHSQLYWPNVIFNAKTGREPGNLIPLIGEGSLAKPRTAEPSVPSGARQPASASFLDEEFRLRSRG